MAMGKWRVAEVTDVKKLKGGFACPSNNADE